MAIGDRYLGLPTVFDCTQRNKPELIVNYAIAKLRKLLNQL